MWRILEQLRKIAEGAPTRQRVNHWQRHLDLCVPATVVAAPQVALTTHLNDDSMSVYIISFHGYMIEAHTRRMCVCASIMYPWKLPTLHTKRCQNSSDMPRSLPHGLAISFDDFGKDLSVEFVGMPPPHLRSNRLSLPLTLFPPV